MLHDAAVPERLPVTKGEAAVQRLGVGPDDRTPARDRPTAAGPRGAFGLFPVDGPDEGAGTDVGSDFAVLFL
jgi:hypothetical protein